MDILFYEEKFNQALFTILKLNGSEKWHVAHEVSLKAAKTSYF
jgi:hypothetical protein